MSATAVFRRTCPRATSANRVRLVGLGSQPILQDEIVLPVVTRIVHVFEGVTDFHPQILELDLRGVAAGGFRLRRFIMVGTDDELPQMIVLPAHNVLEDGMELRQGGCAPDEDASPHRWIDLPKHDSELPNASPRGSLRNLGHP